MIIKNNKGTAERDRALFWVARAAGMDETRYFMNGVLFLASPANHVTAVATDGRRLHLAVFPETCRDFWDVHYCTDEWHATRIERRTSREVVFGGEIPHTFPNYERVIPQNVPYSVSTEEFVSRPELFLGQLLVAIQDADHLIPRFEPQYVDHAAEAPIKTVSFGPVDKAFRFDTDHQDPFRRMAVIAPMQRRAKR